MSRRFCYEIGGHRLAICYYDAHNDESLLPSFAPFLVDETDDVALTIVVDDAFRMQRSEDEVGQFDCGGCNHGVYQCPDGSYQFEVSDVEGVLCSTMQSSTDFTLCTVALHASHFRQRNYGLNNAVMMAYAFCFATQQTLLVHASVIRKDGYGYLMTAPSGTGKSTHTFMWYKHIGGCDLMNDDNPIVRVVADKVIVYGSPWSGKTPCYRNILAPVGAFVRIQQRPKNEVRRMMPLEAYAELLPAMSSMKWDIRVNNAVSDTIIDVVQRVGVFELGCLPDAEAARVCYEAVRRV